MNIRFKTLVWGIFFAIPLFYSCGKETEIGIDLIDDDFLIKIKKDSSLHLSLSTEYDSQIRSSRFSYMLGSYEDPITGNHKAGFLTRFYFESLTQSLENQKLDSIVIRMYDTSFYYGNHTRPQQIIITEITEALSPSMYADFYARAELPVSVLESAQIIGTQTYTPQLSSDKGFRYKLPHDYAENLFARIRGVYSTNEAKKTVDSLLINTFKGLYLYTDYADAAIVRYVSPHIIIYTSANNISQNITLVPSPTAYTVQSPQDPSSVYIQALSIFEHEFSTAIESAIGKTEVSEFYIKGNAGLKISIDFSEFERWRDSAVIINSAQLFVPIRNTDYNLYPYPPLVNLRIYAADSTLFYTTLSLPNPSGTYTFNCHQFLVKLLQKQDDIGSYRFELTIPDNDVFSNRVVIDEAQKTKLLITYTK